MRVTLFKLPEHQLPLRVFNFVLLLVYVLSSPSIQCEGFPLNYNFRVEVVLFTCNVKEILWALHKVFPYIHQGAKADTRSNANTVCVIAFSFRRDFSALTG